MVRIRQKVERFQQFLQRNSELLSASIGAYGPIAERIKVHCFFAKTVGTVPIFVGSVPFFLCRVNAPLVFVLYSAAEPFSIELTAALHKTQLTFKLDLRFFDTTK